MNIVLESGLETRRQKIQGLRILLRVQFTGWKDDMPVPARLAMQMPAHAPFPPWKCGALDSQFVSVNWMGGNHRFKPKPKIYKAWDL